MFQHPSWCPHRQNNWKDILYTWKQRWARFREEYSGLAGMLTINWQRTTSSLVKPDISVPNNIATGNVMACCTTCGIASRGVSTSSDTLRTRGHRPTTSTVPSKASSKVLHTTAFFTTSTALTAIISACLSGNLTGLIKYRCSSPIVFIARAAEPILPG